MSNYLSRLVAKQFGGDSSTIQPRPVARFESVMAPSMSPPFSLESKEVSEPFLSPPLQPLSPQSVLPQSRIHDESDTDQLSNHSALPASVSPQFFARLSFQPFFPDSATNSIERQSRHKSDILETSTLPISNPLLPPFGSTLPISPTSQIHAVLQPTREAFQPLQSSLIQPSLPLPSDEIPAPPMQMASLPLLAVTRQRSEQEAPILPTAPLLGSPSPSLALPSPPSLPSAVPAPATIQVTIGRIEVRASSPSIAPSAASVRPSTRMSLEEYLRHRSQGKKP